ncbi:MAG: hypothetical protein KDB68_08185 [Planctomycetes bacterium]|nr:hypothetical protein [Planctomycetota bacterium]
MLGSIIIGLTASFAFGLSTLYGIRALRRRKEQQEHVSDTSAESVEVVVAPTQEPQGSTA